MQKRSAVITGLGFVTSIGNDKQTVSESLRLMRSGIGLHPQMQVAGCPIKCAGILKGFDALSPEPEDWKYPPEYSVRRDVLRGFSPHVLYAYCAMLQAAKDAGLKDEEISNPQTGMFTASAGSTSSMFYHLQRLDKMGVSRGHPMGIVSSIVGTLSFNLVSAFKIKGSSCGFASACASSAHAMGFAIDEISLGRQKRMFVVGAEDGDIRTILPFAGMRALSLNPDPATASRPFDKKRDGFVGTGGGVVMVLEEEEEAVKRGAKIYARVRSWGQASDGYNVAIPHPEGEGLATAIANAFKEGDISSEKIQYINAHATSTPIGDVAELKAIKRAFGETPKAAISSTKAITGHGLSLAGVMEAAFCAIAIDEGFLPGSANITELDDAAQGFDILTQSKAFDLKTAITLSSGFGGANTAIILEKK